MRRLALHKVWPLLIAGIFLALSPHPVAAQKTDVVILYNGDHITGEIKQLALGKLQYSTDDAGTIHIEWDKILLITSRHYFQVEDTKGEKYYGSLQPGDSGQIIISVAEFADTLEMESVVRIYPIESRFWDRLDGRIDLGFNVQQANNLAELTLNGEVRYRTEKWYSKINTEMYFQTQDNASSTSRASLTLTSQRIFPSKWSAFASTSIEQNEELSLDRRVSFAGGPGLYFMQTGHSILYSLVGLNLTNEQFTGEAESRFNVEGLLAGNFQHFRFDSPKLDISSGLDVFPGITDWGRIRLDFTFYISYELLKDFTLGLNLFEKFDSRPGEGASKNDFGTSLTVGWKF